MSPERTNFISVVPQSGTLDRARYRKKVVSRLLCSPYTLVPIVLGTTVLLGLWTFSVNAGIAIFGGIACILGGIGTFLTRLFLGGDAMNPKVLSEMQQETQRERKRMLDELELKLIADGDARTEQCLRDLRALAKAFREGHTWSNALNVSSAFDILAGVEQLFNRCVASLERTLALGATAQDLTTPEAREPVLAQREEIIEDVGKSIQQLARILAGIQHIGTGDVQGDSDLNRIREELEQSLEVARMVQKRMRSLDRQIDVDKSL